MKFLVWALLIMVVVWAWRSQASRLKNKPGRKSSHRTRASTEQMVCCAHCQIYIPISEAIKDTHNASEQYFCSQEHAQLHASNLGK
jgi:hypothetical protein